MTASPIKMRLRQRVDLLRDIAFESVKCFQLIRKMFKHHLEKIDELEALIKSHIEKDES